MAAWPAIAVLTLGSLAPCKSRRLAVFLPVPDGFAALDVFNLAYHGNKEGFQEVILFIYRMRLMLTRLICSYGPITCDRDFEILALVQKEESNLP